MGLFDNETEQTSRLQTPDYMADINPLLTSELRGLIGQEFLSPDELVADFSPALQAGINQLISSGQGTQELGNQIAQAGIGGLGAFDMGIESIQNALGGGPAQNMGVNMANVDQYINNDVLQGQIDAALRDPYRQLTEQQLPMAGLAAAASGNAGSTRRDVGEALLQRGYEDRAADISGALRGQAYGQALGIGANEAAQNAALNNSFIGQQIAGGNSLANMGMQGANMATMGNNLGISGIQNQMMGGQMQTDYQQALLNAGLQGFMFPYQQLQMLNPIANQNAQTYGTQINSATNSPGIGNTIAGGLFGLGSAAMMGGFNPLSFMSGMFGGNNFTPDGLTSAANLFG